jgi:transcriptional regulator with XRE-family HTH domain
MRKSPRRYRKTFIREWRKHRGLTQERLAERIDMEPSHLSMLENGHRGYTQETLERIAEALQTDAASLLMRDPSNEDAIWSIWEQAKPGERRQLMDVAKVLIRRTN